MSHYFRLLKYLRPHLGVFGIATGCMLMSSLLDGIQLGAIIPLADRIVTDKAIPMPAWLPGWLQHFVAWLNGAPQMGLLTAMAVAIPFLFFIKALFEFWQKFYMDDATQRVIKDIRQELFNSFVGLSLDYHHKQPTGVTMSRILYDAGVIQNSLTEGLTDLVYQSCQVLVFLSIALVIHWKLALVIF
ncbi:MAG: hypothetical protein HY601_03255, partial [Candidatus Omnitrophica bacterium]|nr:hypothetical protein [Candidatus Omnitrophota bacterium]